MIAGFIFLRLRGILGKRTGFEGKAPSQLKEVLKKVNQDQPKKINENFDEQAQKEFIKGAKIAYETVITDFSDNDNKITTSKPLLNNEIFNQECILEHGPRKRTSLFRRSTKATSSSRAAGSIGGSLYCANTSLNNRFARSGV